MENITAIYENSSTISSLKETNPKIIVDSCLFSISVIGVIGNSLAIFIMSSSSKIRKTKYYILLINQCLLDIASTISIQVNLVAKYTYKTSDYGGTLDWIYCSFVHNQVMFAVMTCSSSFNLSVLSLERMVSIIWPIGHHVNCTKRRMTNIAVSVWIFGAFVMLAHSLPTNGIDENGNCYFWNNFHQSKVRVRIYVITFNFFFNILPFAIMLVAYTVMFVRLNTRGVKSNVKLNVIKMISTCVLLYFLCHALRIYISIMARLLERTWMNDPIFIFAITMVTANSIVNPIVFCVQYRDFQDEMKIQYNRLFGKKKEKYSGNSSFSNTNGSHF